MNDTETAKNELREFYSPDYLCRIELLADDIAKAEALYSGRTDISDIIEHWRDDLFNGLLQATREELQTGGCDSLDGITLHYPYVDLIAYLVSEYGGLDERRDEIDSDIDDA